MFLLRAASIAIPRPCSVSNASLNAAYVARVPQSTLHTVATASSAAFINKREVYVPPYVHSRATFEAVHIREIEKSDISILSIVLFFSAVAFVGSTEDASPAEVKEYILANEKEELLEQAVRRPEVERKLRDKKNVSLFLKDWLHYGNLTSLRIALSKGIDLKDYPGLWDALMYEENYFHGSSDLRSIAFLNAKIPQLINEKDKNGHTPLYRAIVSSLPLHTNVLLKETTAVFDSEPDDYKGMLELAENTIERRELAMNKLIHIHAKFGHEDNGWPYLKNVDAVRQRDRAVKKYEDALRLKTILQNHFEKV